jgi:hypothetical protein
VRHLLACCLLISLTAGVVAQERPNFAGRWIPIGVSSQPEQPLVVTQTTTSLTVENTSSSGAASGIHQWTSAPQQSGSGTSWKGATLVVTFPATPNGVRTESWSLNRTGNLTVIIEVRRPNGRRLLDSFVYSR